MVPPGISMLLIYLEGVRGVGMNCGMLDLLVEEGLEDDHLIAGLDESHECAQHTFDTRSARIRAHDPV